MTNARLLGKLLRKNLSVAQLVGFALANAIGLCIVVIGLQFYADVRNVFSDEDSFINKDYLVLTKEVNGLDAIGGILSMDSGQTGTFTQEELTQLSSQPWVRKMGTFANSHYHTTAVIAQAGQPSLETQMFFESVPSEFLDIDASEWHFDPQAPNIVPIILPKDYLALYNFGFASSQGLPRVSEGMVGLIPIQFYMSGTNGRSLEIKGHVVGFSNRINTIIVPSDFLDWSNKVLGSIITSQETSRVILEVSQPGDAQVQRYLESHHYEVAGDKMNQNKVNYLLTISLIIVLAVGLLISALSFFILILSINLLLQKNLEKLRILLVLGYSPREVATPYERIVILINVGVYILSSMALLIVRHFYLPRLEGLSIPGSMWFALTMGAVIVLSITLGNIVAIRRNIRKLWFLE